MSRTYRKVTPKLHRVYSIEDVMQLYDVCRNTVSNWISTGLQPVDTKSPKLFRGAELVAFHEARRQREKRDLRLGEFKCFACKAAVFPESVSLEFLTQNRRQNLARAICPDCGAIVTKLLNATEYDILQTRRETNTTLGTPDEVMGEVPGGIGNRSREIRPRINTANDRVIYDWLIYAGKFSSKTTDAHLTSIRDFEAYLGGKAFSQVAPSDASGWRAYLIASVDGGTGRRLSRTTVRHRVSHLRLFFCWLAKQPQFEATKAVEDYFSLPKAFGAKCEEPVARVYVPIAEAERALACLPSETLMERRDRAIFAFAYLTGFREAALIATRLGQVDAPGRKVFHDGANHGAKNGKSFTVNWFPRTELFRDVFLAWLEEVRELGFREEDALFAEARVLTNLKALLIESRAPIAPMKTPHAVDAVFRAASEHLGKRITPHSARHTLAQLGDQLCLTPDKRKAYSLNFGHSSESITWSHYGKVTQARKDEIFESFDREGAFSVEELNLMISYHAHELYPGTPEWRHAKALIKRREGGS